MQWFRKHWLLTVVAAVLVIGGIVAVVSRYRSTPAAGGHAEPDLPAKAAAPPDLQKLRDAYAAGKAALERDDGADAVKHFSSFDFGDRAVEEYRLYYLANGYELAGNSGAARATLARLWQRDPKMVHADDAGFHLASLYTSAGDFERSGAVYAALAARARKPEVAASARWNAAGARLTAGDVPGALYAARNILIHHPKSKEAGDAAALVRALLGLDANGTIPLTPSERIERAINLMQGHDPQSALEELTALEKAVPGDLKLEVQLQKGVALHRLRRYEDSNKVLEPLTSSYLKYAIPALQTASRNYAIVASAINPNVTKVVKEKKQVGKVKVRVGKGKKRRTVTKPKFATVNRTIKLVDLAKKRKKDEYDRLASERLKDLLSLKLEDDTRLSTLTALIARAEAKNQDAYVMELVPQLIKIDPSADPALQHFWDKAWAAYSRGDLATARKLLRFIADTYTHPNVKRQSEYWYARTIERLGLKEEARAIYQKLASAPYRDLYAVYSVQRGAKRKETTSNPLEEKKDDWGAVAEKSMPAELRLAYELTALSDMRNAHAETRQNMRRSNRRFAEALLADYYLSQGNRLLMYTALRRAWPQLATPEQDQVPVYFLKMYYPTQYGDAIEKYAKKQNLDPNLVRGLILQESYYNPKAKSRVGATGLMQLMPATANDHGKKLRIFSASSRLENPDINVQLGTYHLRMLLNMFQNNQYLAVASYNAGQGNVLKWRRGAPRKPLDEFLESIPFPETRNYVKRVTMLQGSYARMSS
ncbi:MAG TPA: lytic transglycosylase domain-containing protein [Thermoanaerobaculia bacterium]